MNAGRRRRRRRERRRRRRKEWTTIAGHEPYRLNSAGRYSRLWTIMVKSRIHWGWNLIPWKLMKSDTICTRTSLEIWLSFLQDYLEAQLQLTSLILNIWSPSTVPDNACWVNLNACTHSHHRILISAQEPSMQMRTISAMRYESQSRARKTGRRDGGLPQTQTSRLVIAGRSGSTDILSLRKFGTQRSPAISSIARDNHHEILYSERKNGRTNHQDRWTHDAPSGPGDHSGLRQRHWRYAPSQYLLPRAMPGCH